VDGWRGGCRNGGIGLCDRGLDDTWWVFGRAELAKARREHMRRARKAIG
jgi:hypothetical protein